MTYAHGNMATCRRCLWVSSCQCSVNPNAVLYLVSNTATDTLNTYTVYPFQQIFHDLQKKIFATILPSTQNLYFCCQYAIVAEDIIFYEDASYLACHCQKPALKKFRRLATSTIREEIFRTMHNHLYPPYLWWYQGSFTYLGSIVFIIPIQLK